MFTLDKLRSIMRSCGVEDAIDLDGDILDVAVSDLGYDSLAMLHIASLIQQDTSVPIPDDLALALETPRAVIEYVNTRIEAV